MNKYILTAIFILFVMSYSFAADYYWAANSGNNWNTIANWVDGGGIPIGTIPGNTDIVHFDGSDNTNCTVDVDVNIGGLIVDGYTGTIDINGYSFQITSGDATFNTGTINGGTLTINTTGTVRFAGTTFGAIVNSVSARLYLNGSTFNATATIEKNGSDNDDSNGGNTFYANTTIKNSGSGYMRLGNGNADTLSADLDLINSGSSYIIFAYNSSGNSIGGNFTATNSGNGDTFVEVCYNSASTLNITGNCTINNTGSGSQSRNYFALNGNTNLGGNLILNNNATATSAYIYVGYYSGAQLTVNGNTTISNNGNATNDRIYVGYNGDITFNDTIAITNSSSATNSRVYFNYDDNSNNTYNENIVLENTDADSDGITFGESNGTGTLASGKTITIGSSGFVAGNLEFRNFTQNGTTAQTLTCTGTARIYNYDSNWGGNVSFTAPRIFTQGTTYNGTVYLEKTGAGDDNSAGGNTFTGNTILKNSGSAQMFFGNSSADDFQADLTLENTGSNHLYIAYNSIGNTIAGNLTINHSGNGSTYTAVSGRTGSTIAVTGNVTINNTGLGTYSRVYFCSGGQASIGGDLSITNNGTATNNQVTLARDSSSSLTISGNTTITNNGANNYDRIYVGNDGDVTFNGTLTIQNNSSAASSEIFCNYASNSQNTYNENITVENTNASGDGIRFGQNGGSGTLASGKTITIGSGDFVAGDLRFRNFTQQGTTAQSLTCTGTARIYSYDSEWGGNVSFTAPRIITRGTTYHGTATLKKTGSGNDSSSGDNIFTNDLTLEDSGDGSLYFANNYPDTCQANVSIKITNSGDIYFAHNITNNIITGNLSVENASASGDGRIYIATNSASSISISGNADIQNTGSATTCRTYLGNNGDVTLTGNLTIVNNATATSSTILLAAGSNANVTIGGTTSVANNGNQTTAQVILGYNGDVAFNNTLTITNNSSATNSQVYLNYDDNGHNIYNENIIVESTDTSCDGVLFGYSNGSGELAAGKTITIGSGGFVAGDLRFRNFTQHGTTAQSLTCTGTARIYNYDSEWGGNVSFTAPRQSLQGTTFHGTAYLEKTGAGNDYSSGGNTFESNVDVVNSGSGYFVFGNGTHDDFQANVALLNSGSSRIYFANNGAGHTVAGNMTINNSASGTDGYILISNNSSATLTVNGDVTISNNNGGNHQNIYFGNQGDITVNGDITITNNSSAAASAIYVCYDDNSHGIFNGDITVESTDTSSDGILFGNSNGSGELAAGKTITIGSGGFISGYLQFRNFVKHGNAALSITLTGTAFFYSYDSEWGGNVNFVAPQMITRGTDYKGTAYLEKSGATNNNSAGGNIFEQDAEIVNSGSRYFLMGNNYPDSCLANLTLRNTGSYSIYYAHNAAGNYVNGNISVYNSGTSGNTYIYIATNNSSTLTVTGDIDITNDGSSDNCRTYFGNNGDITLNGNLTATNNASANNSTITLANGTGSSVTINGTANFTNNGSDNAKQFYIGSNGDITFNGTVTINNNSSATNSQVYLNYDDNSHNIYNDNITVTSTDASCDGVLFGHSNGSGELASGKTITIGSGGFVAGTLEFRNFTQNSNTSQSLTCTGTTRIYNYTSTWNGNVSFTAPRIYTYGTTYNGTAYFEKTGSTNDYSAGNNTFNADVTIKNSSSNRFAMGNGHPDDYNANVTFIKTGSGELLPAYNAASTYAGNININSNGQIYFGRNGNGRVIFDGTSAQSINNLGAAQTFIFRDIQTNNPNDEITLNTPVEISVELDLDAGNIITTSTNLLYMRDNSTVSSVSDDAYVSGPIEKIGNDDFTFPVGDANVYAPISISAPSNTGHRFRAQYYNQDPNNVGNRNSLDATINHISYMEYWTLDRTNGASSTNVTLSWDTLKRSGTVSNLSDLTIAHWDGSIWQDYGNDATTGNLVSGTITVNNVSNFSPFTLASKTTENPLPVELINFSAMPNNKFIDIKWTTSSEINNDYFEIQRSSDGINFESIGNAKGAGTSNQQNDYSFIDYSPIIGTSYYRLKQVDFNGKYRYSNIAKVNIKNKENSISNEVNIYPNPANPNNTINVIFNNDINILDIKMFSIQGGEVYINYTINENKLKLNPINIPEGIYFIRINNDYKIITKKIIIE